MWQEGYMENVMYMFDLMEIQIYIQSICIGNLKLDLHLLLKVGCSSD
jgi:hypothetical protein